MAGFIRVRRFAVTPEFARIKEVIPLLNRLSDPAASPQLEDYTYFLRMHARASKDKVYPQLFTDPRFLAIKSIVQSRVSSLSAQSVCDVLYWARIGNISGSCSLLEVLPNPDAVSTRISQLCAQSAFLVRQIVPLLYDSSCLLLTCAPLLQSQVQLLLQDSNEVFSTESLRQLLHTCENMNSKNFRWELLDLTLQRWRLESLQEQDINLISDILADLLRLANLHRSELLDLVVRKFIEELVPRVKELSDFNLKLLIPAIVIRPEMPMDLVPALAREFETSDRITEMHFRTCLGVFYLTQHPQAKSLFSQTLMQQIYTRLSDTMDNINTDSFETLLRSMGKLKNTLPGFLVQKLKDKAIKSLNITWLLSYSVLEQDSALFISTHKDLFETAARNVQKTDLVSALTIIKEQDTVPQELIRIKKIFERNLMSLIRQETPSILQLCNMNEKIYPSTKSTFRTFHHMLLDVIFAHFPVYHRDKAIRYLFLRFADFPNECKEVIKANLEKLGTEDLHSFLRTSNKSIQLKDISAFLTAFQGLLTPSVLMAALEFEFESIPEPYNELLETVNGPFLSTPEFFQFYTRLLNQKSLTSKFWERVAKESKSIENLAVDAKLRVTAELVSRGLLDDSEVGKAKKRDSSMGKLALSSLQEIADILSAVLHGKNMTPVETTNLLFQVKKNLSLLPLAHAIHIFDYYSVYDSPDLVTSELLTCLWDRLKPSQNPSNDTILRLLTPASIIQWGEEKDLTEMMRVIMNSYGQLSIQEKVLFTRIMGQFAIQTPSVWNQLIQDLTRTKELVSKCGSDLLYSMHQARVSDVLFPEFALRGYHRVIFQSGSLSPEEFRKGLIALMRKDSTLSRPENFGRLVDIHQSFPERFPDFKTYLLHMYIQSQGKTSTTKYESLPRFFLNHPICAPFPPFVQHAFSKLAVGYETGVIKAGFLLPYYFPDTKTATWVSSRTCSRLNQRLLGDFSLYWKLAKSAGYSIKFVSEKVLLETKDAEGWCRQVSSRTTDH